MVKIINSSLIQLKAQELEKQLNKNKVISSNDATKAAAGKHTVRNLLVAAGVILAIGVALLISAAATFLLLNPVVFVPAIITAAAVGASLSGIGTILGIAGTILGVANAVKKKKVLKQQPPVTQEQPVKSVDFVPAPINCKAPIPPPPPPINLPKTPKK
jgi:hypothetical protein